MQLMVIGNPDTVRGFALAGVRGEIALTPEALERAMDIAMADEEIGIVLVTQDVAALAPERIDALKGRGDLTPLVIEIPGPEGPDAERPSLSEMIRRITGVRV